MTKVRKAVIPAAGLGTRFLPATKAQPKEMLPILDKPTIQYIIEEAVESGVEDILIITGRGKRAIEDHFDRAIELEETLEEKGKQDLLEKVRETNEIDIHYIRQKEPLGLGHAVLCAKKFIGNEPFGVLLGDDIVRNGGGAPCLKQMIDLYEQEDASVIGVQEVPEQDVSRYGIVENGAEVSKGAYQVNQLIEKPPVEKAPSRLAIMGRYVISPTIFDYLEKTGPGSGGEIQLTDALNDLAKVEKVYAYPFKGTRYDAGDLLGYLKTTVEFALEREDVKDEFKEYLKSRFGQI
ncbi:UTP--glucose-1-phosphate uridylyltransferase GalU [Natranaerobius thermophilus]|uniref:UTP--glucose-1-phosphate uridylyltransferase n=1 Tax=Natranaerobius thermophilus (strain ATCC BAA-1301 / DSM 18059 / JW/NM-WN-LF) TaxID=457570 RepID=B2A1Q0_NATTJ|nr:UTP--glucose-1-phosphate uridylyltransferase GalU [Natranaerobius thermophilus]ACB86097.1 UDP-glucose pyrophosphorylase [Natranaerobius thermophilus JW/NM-WN-LF]